MENYTPTQMVGVYLREVIFGQRLKMGDVAVRAGVAPHYISRLITGEIKDAQTRTLEALIIASGANSHDVSDLLWSGATDPEARAKRWLAEIRRRAEDEEDRNRLLAAAHQVQDRRRTLR